MPPFTGGFDIQSLLAVQTGTVADFGLENAAQAIQNELAVHNALTEGMLTDLTVRTTDTYGAWGGSLRGEMVEVDEYGRAPSQNQGVPGELAWPLAKFQFNVGWTNDWMLQATPFDLARAFQAATRADAIGLRNALRYALFLPTNRTVRDNFVSKAELTVRALVNGDGSPIPAGPNGETFAAGSHTHYLGSAALDATAVDTLIGTIVEHGHGTGLHMYINRAQEVTIRALSGFTPYMDARIIPAVSVTTARGSLDTTRIDNRAIGLIAGAEVFVKPWIPANYVFAYAAGEPDKPLAQRVHTAPAMQGLRVAAQIPDYPLFAEVTENYYGFGAYARTNGAALYVGGTTYVAPSF